MNTNLKIFTKWLAIPIQQHIKRIIHHDQVGFIFGIKAFFNMQINKCGTPHYRMKHKNHMTNSLDTEKNISENTTFLHKKNAQQISYRTYIPQHMNHRTNPQVTSYSMVKIKIFSSKIRNKIGMPILSIYIHST